MKVALFIPLMLVAGCNEAMPTPIQNANVATSDSLPRSQTEEAPSFVQPVATKSKASPLNEAVTIEIDVNVLPDRSVEMRGKTNLPLNTNLMLSIEGREPGGFLGQSKCVVSSDGSFESETFGSRRGLPDGVYVASVVMPIPRVQPPDVREVIGEGGERLSGPLIKRESSGVTASADKEFTVGGEGARQAQQERARDAEVSISKLKLDVCVQLERLLQFKDAQDFKRVGFGRGGPYFKWLSDIEALRDSQPRGANHPIPFELRAAPGDLLTLGFEYMQKDAETEYGRRMLAELKETIEYEKYRSSRK